MAPREGGGRGLQVHMGRGEKRKGRMCIKVLIMIAMHGNTIINHLRNLDVLPGVLKHHLQFLFLAQNIEAEMKSRLACRQTIRKLKTVMSVHAGI